MTTAKTTGVTPMTAVRRWQIGLIVGGIAVLGIGGITMLNDVAPENYLGILIWFAGALILHDGIAAMAVFGASVVLRKAGRRIPFAVLAILQGALVIAAIFTAIVVPAVIKQSIGTANPTILPLNYGLNLVLFYAALAVLTALTMGIYLAVRARRQKLRPSLTQD